MTEPVIEIRDLVHRYGETEVLRGVNLSVQPGEIVGYLGPNGAGKSTTMKVLTGQMEPTSGSIEVAGRDVLREPLEIRRRIAYVPETAPLFEVLSAREHLDLVASLRGLDAAAASRRAEGLLDCLGLAEVAHRPLWTFSRGMKQRVALASAFLHEPEVVLLDEPLYGLDVQTVLLVKEVVRQLAAEGVAVVYCSHLLEVVEQLATRAVILSGGLVVADLSPEDLRGGALGKHQNLEGLFRELTEDRDVERRAAQFQNRVQDPV